MNHTHLKYLAATICKGLSAALFLLFFYCLQTQAQTYVTGEFTPGFGLRNTSGSQTGLAGLVAANAKISFTIAEHATLVTGAGLSANFAGVGMGRDFMGTEQLNYFEVPALLRYEFHGSGNHRRRDKPIRYGSRDMHKREAKFERRHSPFRPHFYAEVGFMMGFLNSAAWSSGDANYYYSQQVAHTYNGVNTGSYKSFNLKPAIGFGVVFGGSHKVCFSLGFQYYSALENQYKDGTRAYATNVSLSTFSLHAGLQVRLGNKKI